MLHPKPLQCIFYSHPWAALLLERIEAIDFEDAVLVELSCQNILSHILPHKPNKQRHLTAVLAAHEPFKPRFMDVFSSQPKDRFQMAMRKCKEMPAPLVFAPEGIGELNQIAALQICANQYSVYKHIILLIHYEEARKFSSLYTYVDKFHILWDIADLPTPKLAELTELLANQPLTAERWGGFQLCYHPRRYLEDSQQRYAFFESVIDSYLLKF